MDLESLTFRYGREIFARVNRRGPLLFTPAWFDDKLMQIGMTDPHVKVQLFRFVDALPLLRSGESIARHLREYFSEAGDALPWWARTGLKLMPSRGLLGGVLAWTARTSATRLARKFIAGSNIPEAIRAVERLRKRSLTFTVDLLGEATITEAEADVSQREYTELVTGLSAASKSWPTIDLLDRDEEGKPLPRVNVSVKLSSLFSQFDPIDPAGTTTATLERLRPILRAARDRGVFVNFDMEQFAFKDVTLHLFRTVLEEPEFRDWPDVGIAIQAYLRETEKDLVGLRDWSARRGTPVWVRLVKGAYWDFETILAQQQGWPIPVWRRKWQTDACYERLTRFLLENRRWLKPAFASHNIRSLAHALALAQILDAPPRSYEIQMLYGMADPIKDVFVSLGQRVRVYTPYGELLPGMAYLVRRLLENTANDSFLRAGFTENVPEEQLLMNPEKRGELASVGRQPHDSATPQGADAPRSPVLTIEPLTDFRLDEARQAMQAALTRVGEQLGQTYYPILNGQIVRTPQTVASLDPSRKSQVVGQFGRGTPDQAHQAIDIASAAFPAWRDTPAEKRAQYLFDIARILQRRKFELAAWMVFECGKSWREADADVAETIDYANYYGQEMLRLASPRLRNVPGEDNNYFYEPRGVVVVIAPWNFPLAILAGMTMAAVVTGNTAVMKPAEQSAVIGAKLMEVFQEANLPPGVVQFLPGIGEEVGPPLTNHPATAMIVFTGSRKVGLMLNSQGAEVVAGQDHIKRIVAEMGGKNAIILDDDADLDEATHGVVWSAFGYQGQKCSACSRVIVPETLYERFLPRLIEATKSLRSGPAEDPGFQMGPVIDEEAYDRIRTTIETTRKDSSQGRLVHAGDVGELAREGYYIGPHIFADVPPSCALAQEEIFGPVLAVIKAKNLDESLAIANGTRYALTGGFYSRSPANIQRVRREFRVGNLYINRKITGALVDRQPFGGFKMSGIGSKAGGPDYLLQFVLPRTITENTMRRGFAPEVDDEGGI